MRKCLALAAKGEGRVSPNPLVGAVVVRNGRIIGEGFHEKFGGAHAEANALTGMSAGAAKGATLYVSLEPCSHCGGKKKTPPCVPLVIKSGVSRVVIAATDTNPLVNGCGISQLRAAGIRVQCGLMEKEAREQNEFFFKHIKSGKPFFLLKLAQSKNGKIGVRGMGKVRISGKEFDKCCHRLRNRYDAILVGVATVISDNPRLTCRMKGGRNPARIILDSHLRIPLSARVLRNAKREKVLVFTSEIRVRKQEKALLALGAKAIVCGKRKVDLKKMARALQKFGIYSVLVEGGAKTAEAFLKAGLADKLVLATSPKKISAKDAVASPFNVHLLRSMKNARKGKMGRDRVIIGQLKP